MRKERKEMTPVTRPNYRFRGCVSHIMVIIMIPGILTGSRGVAVGTWLIALDGPGTCPTIIQNSPASRT
jgi:hypothetical protein